MNRWLTLFLFVFIYSLEGCKDESGESIVSDRPVITSSWLGFVNGSASSKVDTLSLTFDFTDGVFDYGLNPGEVAFPFHPFNFFISNGDMTPTSIAGELIMPSSSPPFFLLQPSATQNGTIVTLEKLKHQDPAQTYICGKFTSSFDPVGVKMVDNKFVYNPASITDTISSGLGQILILTDQFLIERNRNHYNLIVDYLAEQADGSFEVFDWQKEFCIEGYNARVPLGAPQSLRFGPFKIQGLSDQRAIVTYNMASIGFRRLFGGKRLKIRLSIIDRSLNESPVVETGPILVPKE